MNNKYKELKEKVKKYSESYYKNSISLVSDDEFDALMKELEKMENEQGFRDDDSPTISPGSDLSSLSNIKHITPMLSLQNTKSKDDVSAWYEKMKKYGVNEFIVETKIDGNAISLKYEKGKFIQALSRGDGEKGEDLTKNISLIAPSINKKISFEIRGEVVIKQKEFERLNKNFEYANARNLASGTLKLLDQEEFKKRKLSFIMYWGTSFNSEKHSEDLKEIKDLGFEIPPYYICKNLEEIMNAIKKIDENKNSFEYAIDGAVIKVNEKKLWDKIGGTAKFPHYAVAYKYPPETAESKITDIVFQVGRTGKITPLAYFTPVQISGSTVQKATLNNNEWMKNLGVKIGDFVEVSKHCEIIPYIDKVFKDKRDGSEKSVIFPKRCPACGEKLIKKDDSQVDYFCPNDSCPAKIVDKIINFTSLMEIDGFAEVLTERLHNAGLLYHIEDLLNLKKKKEKIILLDRFSETIFNKMIDNIEKAKSKEAWKFLAAIGIPGVGPKLAKVLIKRFNSIKILSSAKLFELLEVPDIGEKTANSIIEFFAKKENKKMIKCFEDAGFNLSDDEGPKGLELTLEGKTIVITGSLSKPRSYFQKLIEMLGGKLGSSVTSKTSYLLTNNKNSGSTKNREAEKLSIPIINEEEFFELCNSAELLKELGLDLGI